MIRRAIIYAPEARDDLLNLYDWIADAASPATALAYTDRLASFLRNFDIAAERGTIRDDVRPGLRVVGYRRRITVAFTVEPERVTILRILHAGRDWSSAFTADDEQ